MSGDLQPGEPLKEAHLARQLHVSQVPVREALLQLENLGLVVRVQDKGTTVTKLSRAEMTELYQVRAHLEEFAFRLAAPRLTGEALKQLRDCVKDLEKKIARNDYYGVGEADLAFHRTVWSHCGNRVLENMLERLCISIMAFGTLQRHAAKETLKDTVARQHTALLDALKKRKLKAISAAIREHMNPDVAMPSNVVD